MIYANPTCKVTMLHHYKCLLLVLFGCSAAMGQNLADCYISAKSTYASKSCSVKRIACALDVSNGLLYLPPVDNLRVTSEALQDCYSEQCLQSLVHVNWSLPSHIEHRDDFLVQLQASNNTKSVCYLIKLDLRRPSTSTYSSEGTTVEFKLPLRPNCYSIKVQRITGLSLPTTNSYLIPQSVVFVKKRDENYKDIPALWITDLVLNNDSCNCSISVTFELAPIAYNFTIYVVTLNIMQSDPVGEVFYRQTSLNVTGGQNQGTVVFANVTAGKYKVLVYPKNTDENERNCRCQCRNAKIPACENNEICPEFGCIRTVSDVTSIDRVYPHDCTVPYVDTKMPVKFTGIGVGCIAAVSVLTAIICILRRTKHIDIDLRELPSQPVFLLFTNDHKCHQSVIHHLIEVLERHCNVSVKTIYNYREAAAQSLFDVVRDIYTNSDKILIINSDGMARCFSDSERITLDPFDSQVKPFLLSLRNHQMHNCTTGKLIMTRFDYTKLNDIAEKINHHEREHVLMRDFESLLLQLHGFKKQNGRTVFHVKNLRNWSSIPEFEKLTSAVSTMKSIAESNSLCVIPVAVDAENNDVTNDCETDLLDSSFTLEFHPPSLDNSSITSVEQLEFLNQFSHSFDDND